MAHPTKTGDRRWSKVIQRKNQKILGKIKKFFVIK